MIEGRRCQLRIVVDEELGEVLGVRLSNPFAASLLLEQVLVVRGDFGIE